MFGSIRTQIFIAILLSVGAAALVAGLTSSWILSQDKRTYLIEHQAISLKLQSAGLDGKVERTLQALQILLLNPNRLVEIAPNLEKKAGFAVGKTQLEDVAPEVIASSGFATLPQLKDFFATFKDELKSRGFAAKSAVSVGLTHGLVVALYDSKAPPTVPNFAFAWLPGDTLFSEARNAGNWVVDSRGKTILESPQGNSAPADYSSWAFSNPASQTTKEVKEANGADILLSSLRTKYGLAVLMSTDLSEIFRSIRELSFAILASAFVTALLALFFGNFLSRSILKPLDRLKDYTVQIGQGDFDLKVDIQRKDEFGALGKAFEIMSARIRELIQDAVIRTRLEGELNLAAAVQRTLIPPSSIKGTQYSIDSEYRSAGHCGGDFWTCFELDKKLFFIIADATGHGVSSALITAAARSCLSVLEHVFKDEKSIQLSPSVILRYFSQAIYDSSHGEIQMTGFVGCIELATGRLTYCNAAHPGIWVYDREGGPKTRKSLLSKGERLGESAKPPVFEEESMDLPAHARIVLLTDGVLEFTSPTEEMFGKMRLKNSIDGTLSQNAGIALRAVVKESLEFQGECPLPDDYTLAFLDFNQNGKTIASSPAAVPPPAPPPLKPISS